MAVETASGTSTAHEVTGVLDMTPAVEHVLREFLADADARTRALDPDLQPLVSVARDAALNGGKRLRPAFAYWGWRGVVAPDTAVEPALPAFAALELLQAFALVQDDVIYDSPIRRGQPAAHAVLAALHRERNMRGDPVSFGRSGATLVGDLCLVWADQLLASAGLPREALTTVRHIYDGMRVRAIAGQFLDVLGEDSPEWPAERALAVARLKTAYYTIVGPLRYGAALGRPSPSTGTGVPKWDPPPGNELDTAYTRYGLAVGEAFQLRDDLLDCYGDPAVTGKPVDGDLRRGRSTVLLRLARTMANRRQRHALDRELASPFVDVEQVVTTIAETGAVDLVEWRIATRVGDAISVLTDAPVSEPVKTALTRLAQFAMRRTT